MDHIEIYVSDLENSFKFYSWLLPKFGFKVFQEWDEGFSYRKNDFYIVFIQTKGQYLPSTYHRCHVGLNHLAFHCDKIETIDHIHQYCLDNHLTLLYEEYYPYAAGKKFYAVFFEDPDRIKIEVMLRKD